MAVWIRNPQLVYIHTAALADTVPGGVVVGGSVQRRVGEVGGEGRRGLESPLNEGVVGHSGQLLDMGSAVDKQKTSENCPATKNNIVFC